MSRNGHRPERLERALVSLDRLPRPVYARVESLPPGSWTRLHRHDWTQLSYAVRGVLTVHTAAGTFFAPPQRAVWIPAGLDHEVSTSGRAEMRSLYLDRRVRSLPSRCGVVDVSPLVRELIRAVCSIPVEYDERGPDGRLVRVLLDQLRALPEVAFSLPMPADPRLARVAEALQRAPDERRTLAGWARGAGASERTLARLFRRETGLAFGEWRRRLRLLASLSALEEGASVTAVAIDCGYESPSAFIAAFRRLFGGTPAEFVRDRQPAGPPL